MRAALGLVVVAGCLTVPPATDDDSTSTTDVPVSTSTSSTPTDAVSTAGSASTMGEPTTSSMSSGSTSIAETTTGTTGDDGLLDIDGELIEVPPGWSGGVWFDFSDQYVFDADAYFDDPYTFNNAPQSMFILRDPFEPGLGVITVHDVIELRSPGAYAEHDFFRATGATGPDALSQAADCRGWNGIAEGYCFNAGSQDGGDGLFVVTPDWQMSLVETINNCNHLGFDPEGLFDGSGEPTLFYGTPDNTIRYPDDVVLAMSTQPRIVLEDGRLAVIASESGLQRLGLIDPDTLDLAILRTEVVPKEPIARQNVGALRIATGDLSMLPGVLYVLVQASQLFEYDADGAGVALATTVEGQGWRWASVVIPEPDHVLARDGGPTFYILEGNRELDRDRVIWLQGPAG